jgi:hypothetical protein
MPDANDLDAASDLVDHGPPATPHVAPGAPPKVESPIPGLPPEQHPKLVNR